MYKQITLAICLLALCGTVQASEITLEWSAPDKCQDGSALGSETCTALNEYRLQCSTSEDAAPYGDLEWRISAPATSDTRHYPPGDYWCKLSVSNAAGWSKWTVETVHFVSIATPEPPSKPARPADFKVVGTQTAYTIIQSRDRIALVAAGIVADGTVCDAEQPVLDKWVVPVDAVTWTGSVQSEVAVSDCG